MPKGGDCHNYKTEWFGTCVPSKHGRKAGNLEKRMHASIQKEMINNQVICTSIIKVHVCRKI